MPEKSSWYKKQKKEENSEMWVEIYIKKGAYWLHDANPKRPHALLTSGKHSSGFFNSELIMEDPVLVDQACRTLVDLLIDENLDPNIVDRVVGPAMGAITLANDIARYVSFSKNAMHRAKHCLRAYVEKENEGDSKTMVFKRTKMGNRETVLLTEDVITTGGSVELTAKAVSDAGGLALPFVVTLINRSGLNKVKEKKIVALVDREMPIWTPEECPLCKNGSEAIKPKGVENWARLNAVYKK
jgi:orotate phosphoribosyltransferase